MSDMQKFLGREFLTSREAAALDREYRAVARREEAVALLKKGQEIRRKAARILTAMAAGLDVQKVIAEIEAAS